MSTQTKALTVGSILLVLASAGCTQGDPAGMQEWNALDASIQRGVCRSDTPPTMRGYGASSTERFLYAIGQFDDSTTIYEVNEPLDKYRGMVDEACRKLASAPSGPATTIWEIEWQTRWTSLGARKQDGICRAYYGDDWQSYDGPFDWLSEEVDLVWQDRHFELLGEACEQALGPRPDKKEHPEPTPTTEEPELTRAEAEQECEDDYEDQIAELTDNAIAGGWSASFTNDSMQSYEKTYELCMEYAQDNPEE